MFPQLQMHQSQSYLLALSNMSVYTDIVVSQTSKQSVTESEVSTKIRTAMLPTQ